MDKKPKLTVQIPEDTKLYRYWEYLSDTAATQKEVAEALGLNPLNVGWYKKILKDSNLLWIVGYKRNRRNPKKPAHILTTSKEIAQQYINLN